MQNQLSRAPSRWSVLLAILILMIAGPGCEILNQAQTDSAPSPTAPIARAVSPAAGTSNPGANPTAPGSPSDPKTTPAAPGSASPTIPSQPLVKPLKMNSPEYGIQAFLWWRPETAERDVSLLQGGGVTWVKQIFAWRDIEGSGKGKFDWSRTDRIIYLVNARGVDVLARIDNAPDWAAPGCNDPAKKQMGPAKNTQDWLDFLTAFVTRYKGRVRAYEIWNEPNLAREWCGRPPSPSEYAALLKASYAKIKSLDPGAMIITAGMTPTTQNNSEAMPDVQYIEQMYTVMGGSSTGYFDVLGVHAAGFKAPPEVSPDDIAKNPQYNHGEGALGRIYGFRHAEDIRKVMVAKGDSAKQIAVLEFGWTSDPVHPAYSWFRVDEQTKGQYIVNAFKYAKQNWSPWIGGMFLIYMANPDWTKDSEEYWWAITEPDGTPRPAAIMLKAMPK